MSNQEISSIDDVLFAQDIDWVKKNRFRAFNPWDTPINLSNLKNMPTHVINKILMLNAPAPLQISKHTINGETILRAYLITKLTTVTGETLSLILDHEWTNITISVLLPEHSVEEVKPIANISGDLKNRLSTEELTTLIMDGCKEIGYECIDLGYTDESTANKQSVLGSKIHSELNTLAALDSLAKKTESFTFNNGFMQVINWVYGTTPDVIVSCGVESVLESSSPLYLGYNPVSDELVIANRSDVDITFKLEEQVLTQAVWLDICGGLDEYWEYSIEQRNFVLATLYQTGWFKISNECWDKTYNHPVSADIIHKMLAVVTPDVTIRTTLDILTSGDAGNVTYTLKYPILNEIEGKLKRMMQYSYFEASMVPSDNPTDNKDDAMVYLTVELNTVCNTHGLFTPLRILSIEGSITKDAEGRIEVIGDEVDSMACRLQTAGSITTLSNGKHTIAFRHRFDKMYEPRYHNLVKDALFKLLDQL